MLLHLSDGKTAGTKEPLLKGNGVGGRGAKVALVSKRSIEHPTVGNGRSNSWPVMEKLMASHCFMHGYWTLAASYVLLHSASHPNNKHNWCSGLSREHLPRLLPST